MGDSETGDRMPCFTLECFFSRKVAAASQAQAVSSSSDHEKSTGPVVKASNTWPITVLHRVRKQA